MTKKTAKTSKTRRKARAAAPAPRASQTPIFVSTLRPGLLVHVSTSIKGNVSYEKSEETVTNARGVEISEWETTRYVKDPKEQKLATEIRSKARNLVVSVCAATEHGLLCPEDKRSELEEAYVKARQLCAEFNATAKNTRLKFNALAGIIEPNDRKAVRAINGEVRELLSEIQAGIDSLDVERIRDASSRVKKIGNMLAPDMQARINGAVTDIRSMAKKMLEAGEQAATQVDSAIINKLAAARTSFLDIEDGAEVQDAAITTGRTLDLAPHETPAAPKAAPAPKAEIE